ncbi:zinc finger X-chromosomal protein-like [Pygocentrus nattereri]|uniref:THAP-type domain-containing protein n=1 Tax=Pygocentrus nattereri TaxID=42514 RepID=A0AAR2JE24_PYGNA|nr:zinc finger X-chromosomal protein-like [Pygocentrus nattereri]
MSKKTYYQRRESFSSEYCCVPLCGATAKYNSVLSFHAFPSDDELRKAWIINIRRDNLTITPHTRVCSRHFRPEDIRDRTEYGGRRRLIKGAAPVLFQWNDYGVGGRLDGLKRLVLESEEEIISVLTASHVSDGGYHYDTQQTKDIISARYYWPDMSNRIKTWVDACDGCVKMDNGTSGGTTGYLDRAPQKAMNEARISEATHVVREAQDMEPKFSATADFKKQMMSSGNGGSNLQCPYCYFQCNTKCSFQIHVGSQHPLHCEDVSVGRLGKVIFYQRTAKLFHCYICFFTSKDYSKLFNHLLVQHSFSGKALRKDEALGLKQKSDEAKESCRASKDSKDSDSSEVGHGEGSERDKVPSPKMQSDGLMDVDTLKTEEGQSIEGGALNGSNEDSNFSSSLLKRKRGSASCSEDDDDEEEDEDELDSSQAAKEEKNAAVMKYTEHLSTRYYYCKFCKWRSKKKGFLLYHVSQKHDVPKPHACKECKKTFMLETLLTKHVKLFHKQGLYQCPFCPFESNFLRGIRRHLNNCRGEEGGEIEGHMDTEEKE